MKNYIFPIITAICFGIIGVTIRSINNEVPIMSVIALRTIIGFLFFWIVIPLIDKDYRNVTKKDLFNFAIIGFLLALSMSMFQMSFLHAPVSNVELIFSINVILIGILGFLFLKEKITAREIITISIALIGLYIINPFQSSFIKGNILTIIAAASFSSAVIFMRRVDQTHDVCTIFWIFLFSSLMMLPFPFIYGLGNISKVIHLIILLGILCTGVAYLCLTYALEHLKAEDVSVTLIIFEPLTAIILSILILKEYPQVNVLVGGLILLFAGIVFELRNKELQKA